MTQNGNWGSIQSGLPTLQKQRTTYKGNAPVGCKLQLRPTGDAAVDGESTRHAQPCQRHKTTRRLSRARTLSRLSEEATPVVLSPATAHRAKLPMFETKTSQVFSLPKWTDVPTHGFPGSGQAAPGTNPRRFFTSANDWTGRGPRFVSCMKRPAEGGPRRFSISRADDG